MRAVRQTGQRIVGGVVVELVDQSRVGDRRTRVVRQRVQEPGVVRGERRDLAEPVQDDQSAAQSLPAAYWCEQRGSGPTELQELLAAVAAVAFLHDDRCLEG